MLPDYRLRPDRDLTILIPARAGSKRVPGKNTRLLGGKPLIQWTIEAAQAAHVAEIVVSTDDPTAAGIASAMGCRVHARAYADATDDAPDVAWVSDLRIDTHYFAICRPTSPFRTASTIRRAFAALIGAKTHSVRAVERVIHPHPAKMWMLEGKAMRPVMVGSIDGTPYHSCPTQSLPVVYRQNASLEMAQTWVIEGTKTISGHTIAPFLTDAIEGFDINTPEDFEKAERLLADRERGPHGGGSKRVGGGDDVLERASNGIPGERPAPCL